MHCVRKKPDTAQLMLFLYSDEDFSSLQWGAVQNTWYYQQLIFVSYGEVCRNSIRTIDKILKHNEIVKYTLLAGYPKYTVQSNV